MHQLLFLILGGFTIGATDLLAICLINIASTHTKMVSIVFKHLVAGKIEQKKEVKKKYKTNLYSYLSATDILQPEDCCTFIQVQLLQENRQAPGNMCKKYFERIKNAVIYHNDILRQVISFHL